MNQPLAYIHPEAKIGENVVIGPFTTIDRNVEIGEGTKIGSNVTILYGARIGKNCTIFPGAVVGAIPQDLKFHGEDTLAIVGDNTTLRECVTVNRGTDAKGKTVVGSNCLIMAYSHIAHDCVIADCRRSGGRRLRRHRRRCTRPSVLPHRTAYHASGRCPRQQGHTSLRQSST